MYFILFDMVFEIIANTSTFFFLVLLPLFSLSKNVLALLNSKSKTLNKSVLYPTPGKIEISFKLVIGYLKPRKMKSGLYSKPGKN